MLSVEGAVSLEGAEQPKSESSPAQSAMEASVYLRVRFIVSPSIILSASSANV